jgi:hypothetical protein
MLKKVLDGHDNMRHHRYERENQCDRHDYTSTLQRNHLRLGTFVRFDIKFNGPDAAKVKIVRIYLTRKTDVPPDQSGFSVTPQGGDFSPDPSGVFKTEIKIPEGTPTGDYALQVVATGQGSAGSATYDAGDQFQLHRFHIANPATFTPPHITVKELP